jgi:short subunit dehydrogenase-like uncharacterized protein
VVAPHVTAALIYGSYGYTGRLVVAEARRRGVPIILAGRNRGQLARQATELGLEFREARLDDPAALATGLSGIDVVLHCAGPFVHTSRPMVEACLRAGTHYVDISGEIDGFEALARRDTEAREAGIALLPGAGFDVVPSDCLCAYLAGRLPGASHLKLFVRGSGGVSRGTARSAIENMGRQGRIRRNGSLVEVPAAWRIQAVNFGRGDVQTVSVGWGDVSTAFYSTGIPNVEAYLALPVALIALMRAARRFGPVLYSRPMKAVLKAVVTLILPPGPSDWRNKRAVSQIIGEVSSARGMVRAMLETPAAYPLTAVACVELVRRILAGEARPGFQTPSRLFSADFVLTLPGVRRIDLNEQ